ncbi:MAG: methylenetetrahydrofolate reductase [NAD(P)H], partial [Phycisphaerales bacterium]
MHARDHYTKSKTTFSFEFFPPKNAESAAALFESIRELDALKPSFVSVTYGAGGATRGITQDLVFRIRSEIGLPVVPHLTCVCHTEAEIYDILDRYAAAGISNILCLGGDPPKDKPGYNRSRDAFLRAAHLVQYVKDFSNRHGGRTIVDPRGFGIGVAGFPEGHPGTPNRLLEMDHLKAKVDEGADFIVTQLFFDNRDFYDFRERCELAGIDIPIVAGIMPIGSVAGMRRMADLAAGARFPAALLKAIRRSTDSYGEGTPESREAVRRVGIHWATEQCRDLLDHNVRGLHFYTLNQSTATREIYANLGVRDSAMLV